MILTKEILARAAECPRAAAFLAAGTVPAEETVGEWMNRVFRETRDVVLDTAQILIIQGISFPGEFVDDLAHTGLVELRRRFRGSVMIPRPGGRVRNLSGRGVERDAVTVQSVLVEMVENLVVQIRTLVERHGQEVKFGGDFEFKFSTARGVMEYGGTAHAVAEDTKDLYLFEPIGRAGNEHLILEGFGAVLEAGLFDCHSVHGIGILRTLDGGVLEASRAITGEEQTTARGSAAWYHDAIERRVGSFQCHTAFGPCPYQGACRGDHSNSDGHQPVKLINTTEED